MNRGDISFSFKKPKALFTRSKFAAPDDDTGVSIADLGCAITTWAAMNGEVSVADAMVAFNTTRDVIVEAVEGSAWAFLSDPTCDDPTKTMIELDGE